jgi:Kelch motif protein
MVTTPPGSYSAIALSSSPSDTSVLRFGGSVTTSELYHSSTGTWAQTGSINTARTAYGVAKLSNGDVFVAGGLSNSQQYLTGTEEYSPSTGTWTTRASMNNQRARFSLTLLGGTGQVLAVAGTSVSGPLTSAELYTP